MPEFLFKISPLFDNNLESYYNTDNPINSYSIKVVLKTRDRILDLGSAIPAKA